MLPEKLRPMPLSDALVGMDAGDHKVALAKLIAAGGLEKRHGLYQLTATLFDEVIGAEERGTEAEKIFGELTDLIQQPMRDREVGLFLDSRGYGAAVHQVLFGQCRKTTTDTDVDFDVNTLVSTATVQIVVERPFADLAQVMDPRSWEALGPDYFRHSYKARQTATGKIRYIGDEPEPDPAGKTTPPGTTWQGVLFEQFQWNWNEATLSEFRNLLNIDYEAVQDREITLKYNLSQSIDSTVGYDVQQGGIDVDSGTATARPSGTPNSWLVTASKSIRFTDRTPGNIGLEVPFDLGMALNFIAPSILGIFLDRCVYLAVCTNVP